MKGGVGNFTTLAWAGWRVRIPPDWRPLDILGGVDMGRMVVGDADAAILQVKWSRPAGGEKFDPRGWAREHGGMKPPTAGARGGVPSPQGFQVLGFSPLAKAARGASRAVWHGFSRRANLLIEAVAFVGDRPHLAGAVRNEVLPSLRATGRDEPTGWAVFQVSFRTPPRFDVAERRFQPGHMAALFRAPGERLLLRQAYPRAAALGRRDLVGWLRSEPFPQRRRFYPAGDPRPWAVESFGRELTGLIRFGRRKLAAPLGWAAPRWTVQAIVEDPRLDRLLLAECDTRRQVDDELAAEAIAGMNWAVFE